MTLTVKEAKEFIKKMYRRLYSEGPEKVPAIFLMGPPGVGKSSIVKQSVLELTQELGQDVYIIDIRLSQFDPTDIKGLPRIEQHFVEWILPKIWPRRGNGILFLDEINLAPPAVQAAAYQLILDRRIGDYEVPRTWMIIAAGNPPEQALIAYPLPPPLRNRFVILEIGVDFKAWIDWALKAGIHQDILSFLSPVYRRELYLFRFDPDRPFPSPRSWEFVSRLLEAGLNETEIREGVFGSIGQAVGIEFLAWRELNKEVRDIPDRIIRGEKVDLKPIITGESSVQGIKFKRLDLLWFILYSAFNAIPNVEELPPDVIVRNFSNYLVYLYNEAKSRPDVIPPDIVVTFGMYLLEHYDQFIPDEIRDILLEWTITEEYV